MSRSLLRAWIVRGALLFASWHGMGSDSGFVWATSEFVFVLLVLSSVEAAGRKKPVPAVLHEGDTRIVLHAAIWRDQLQGLSVLQNDFNIPFDELFAILGKVNALGVFEKLPVMLAPAVPGCQAEEVVAKLNRAGCLASAVPQSITTRPTAKTA